MTISGRRAPKSHRLRIWATGNSNNEDGREGVGLQSMACRTRNQLTELLRRCLGQGRDNDVLISFLLHRLWLRVSIMRRDKKIGCSGRTRRRSKEIIVHDCHRKSAMRRSQFWNSVKNQAVDIVKAVEKSENSG